MIIWYSIGAFLVAILVQRYAWEQGFLAGQRNVGDAIRKVADTLQVSTELGQVRTELAQVSDSYHTEVGVHNKRWDEWTAEKEALEASVKIAEQALRLALEEEYDSRNGWEPTKEQYIADERERLITAAKAKV